jgi:hypothetical protein
VKALCSFRQVAAIHSANQHNVAEKKVYLGRVANERTRSFRVLGSHHSVAQPFELGDQQLQKYSDHPRPRESSLSHLASWRWTSTNTDDRWTSTSGAACAQRIDLAACGGARE